MGAKNLIVISHEGFSKTSSNGRTLGNFLVGWPKENLAQFYIKESDLDYSLCKNYFHVTDQNAKRAFFGKGMISSTQNSSNVVRKNSRNSVTMFAREIVWTLGNWKTRGFTKWINEFNPDCVLLQAGDSAFSFRLAIWLSKTKSIPLIVYNSENYYFKKFDYFRSTGIPHILYPIYHRYYLMQYRLLMMNAQRVIYNTEDLASDYNSIFHVPYNVIYTSSEIQYYKKAESDRICMSYLGNLGLGRHKLLIEIGEILLRSGSFVKLNVYGKFPNDSIKKEILDCAGIDYKGFVDYDSVKKIMQNSDVLVHVENFDPFYKEGLKRAFSTKIADSLASGACFLLYAPHELTCYRYLQKNDAAFLASSHEELEQTILRLLFDNKYKEKHITNAIELVKNNHNLDRNAMKFQTILHEVMQEYKCF